MTAETDRVAQLGPVSATIDRPRDPLSFRGRLIEGPNDFRTSGKEA